MKIELVVADAFGPLRDQTLTLTPGFNVLFLPNEAGKSTWHAALIAALCGTRRGVGAATREARDFALRHPALDGYGVGRVHRRRPRERSANPTVSGPQRSRRLPGDRGRFRTRRFRRDHVRGRPGRVPVSREGFNNPDHAAHRYSWIRPPSTSFRSTGVRVVPRTCGVRLPAGTTKPSPRCGLSCT